jgi:hypothetical protein
VQKLAFLPWVIAALEAFGAIGCGRVSSQRVQAIVTDAKDASLNSNEILLAGEKISSGTSLQTGGGGHADLMLLPNMLLRLGGNGDLRVANLKFSVDGNETAGGVRERAAAVALVRGGVIARAEQHGYNTAELVFQTARARIRAEASALFEIAEQPDATSATCVRGHLEITRPSADHVSTVLPGEIMLIDNAGSRHLTLDATKRQEAEARCSKAEASLVYEATAQIEARR